MQHLKISIIIPCYNCEKTLREAVDSCYSQGFAVNEFEIILVDDKSTDNTWPLLEKLATEHNNIRVFQHTVNKGGGATRNTATEKARANLVFCLDSDDILTPLMLQKMVRMQQQTGADAIGIETSVKFRGNNVNDIAYTNIFGYRNEIIPLISLLQYDEVMCPLYSTFLYTKEAFSKAGGYPTEHGFDTQGFAWRFLAKGLTAYTCPDTTYLHRIDFHESYYLKEYQAGRTNVNWKKILIEQNAILCDEAYKFVIDFNELDFETSIIDGLKSLPKVFSATPIMRELNPHAEPPKTAVPRNSLRGILYRLRSRMRRLLNKITKPLHSYFEIIKNHVASKEPLYALLAWHLMRLMKLLKIDFMKNQHQTDDVLDLFLPTIAKDFETLELVIEAAKKNILHKIGNVYIVTRPNESMCDFCRQHGYILIDESSVLGYGVEKINYTVDGINRSGWLLQQLLKFAADRIVGSDNFISVDSDTIIIKPLCFINKGKFVFRQNEEWHQQYFSSFKKLFGYPAQTWFSYTSHMMIFNKKMLRELRKELEERNHTLWDTAYISSSESGDISCISDYDTYANWVRCNYPSQVESWVLYNRTLARGELTTLSALEEKYGNKYHTVSFHSYVK